MRAGMSEPRTGKWTPSKSARRRAESWWASFASGYMRSVVSRRQSGPKKGRPMMWSQCTWVSRSESGPVCPSASRTLPSSRIPVPASKMSSAPSARRTSTQTVLPP